MARERIFLILIVFMLIANVRASVMINEVMPHSNNSYGDEWVELHNNGALDQNLVGWIISDGKGNDSFSLNISAGGFALIVDNSNNNCSFFSISNESCFEVNTIGSTSLSDDGESVILYDNNSVLISNFSWDRSIKSSGRSWDYNGTTWLDCIPTPATANNCTTEQNQTQQNQTQTQNSSTNETQSQNTESSLSIIDAPTKASFGETIDVDISAYRGDTAKYAIYLYIRKDEDIVSEKVSLHLDNKFTDYLFTVPLKIKPNCDAGYDEGSYDIILEGLDKLALEEIVLRGNAECESEEFLKRGKVSYKIDFPDEVQAGKEFIVSVKIYNNQNKRQQFGVWSYVYQNNKCYSCGNKTREANAEQAIIDKYESATVFLKNTVYSADKGAYKLKVKILKEGYETTKDFTFDIFVKNVSVQENKTNAESILNSEPLANESSEQNKITGKVVYKADKKSPLTTLLLFTVLCLLLLLYFMLKRKQPRAEGKGFERDEKKTEDTTEKSDIGDESEEDEYSEEENSEDLEEASEQKEPDTNKQDEIDSPKEETDEIKENKTEKLSNESDIKTESEKQENGV